MPCFPFYPALRAASIRHSAGDARGSSGHGTAEGGNSIRAERSRSSPGHPPYRAVKRLRAQREPPGGHRDPQYSDGMTQTILVLSEVALTPADLRNLRTLEGEEAAEVVVLIPEDREESLLGEFFRHLSLLEVGEAFRTFSAGDDREDRVEARTALAESLDALTREGFAARGRTTTGDPVAALVEEARASGATQAVVITRPHAIADTFHTDWANKAQDALGIAVLHLYSGSGFIGDS